MGNDSTRGTFRERVAILALAFATVIGGVVAAPAAQAADASRFDPGYIISDANFYDGDSMSAGEIQNFLDQRVPTCRSTSVPCLKSWVQATPTMPAVANRCEAYTGAPSESAATIIAKVGLACGISPKVLLVLLEKEQSLVTTSTPTASRYNFATGFACPDTAPCDAAFSGFFYQVYWAARQFKVYTATPTSWRYRAGQVNSILFHPNAACGSSNVFIGNQATANLYIYTPYQPNAAALANLYGTGDACSAYGNRNFWRIFTDWFGSPTGNPSPRGDLNLITPSFGQARFQGWLHDEDTTDPVAIHVYVGGPFGTGSWGGSYLANTSRPDVSASFPWMGPNHGYDFTIPLPQGSTTVCLYGINVGFGSNVLLGCPVVSLATGPPFGSIDSGGATLGQARLSGWAIDPDTDEGIEIRATIGGSVVATTIANTDRSDVGRFYPGYGPNHGFTITVPLASGGARTICLTAVNVGPSATNSSLGCRILIAPGGNPFGSVDSASASLGVIDVSGWLIDPDVATPVTLHAYVNGAWGGSYIADTLRADVGRAFPGYGDNHGYSVSIPTRVGGRQSVCLYAINIGSGTTNPLMGCRIVTAPGGNPFGNFEGIVQGSDGPVAQGWIIDPDLATPVTLHVYVDGRWYGAFTADSLRNDVAAAYPTYGASHGFRVPLSLGVGAHSVCVFAINMGSGTTNPLMGCRTAVIP